MKKIFGIVALVAILLLACQGNKSQAENQPAGDTSAKPAVAATDLVEFTIINQGFQSVIKEGGDFIIRDQKKLDSLWQLHFSKMSMLPELPSIDFTKETVIAVFLGDKPTTGYWMRLDSTYAKNNELIVAITTNEKPEADKPLLKIATQPYFFAIVEKASMDVKIDFKMQ